MAKPSKNDSREEGTHQYSIHLPPSLHASITRELMRDALSSSDLRTVPLSSLVADLLRRWLRERKGR
jgi:hypothetical protein